MLQEAVPQPNPGSLLGPARAEAVLPPPLKHLLCSLVELSAQVSLPARGQGREIHYAPIYRVVELCFIRNPKP